VLWWRWLLQPLQSTVVPRPPIQRTFVCRCSSSLVLISGASAMLLVRRRAVGVQVKGPARVGS
jgi:hypothetical protein